MSTTKIIKREEQDVKNTWCLEDMFASLQDWEISYKDVEKEAEKITNFKGKLGEGSDTLLQVLKNLDSLNQKLESVYVYAHMLSHQDMGNSKNQALAERATRLNIKVGSLISFVEPEILSIDSETLKSYMNSNNGIKFYNHYLENLLRLKEHILPADQEALLAKAKELSVAPENIFSMLNNADMKFPSIKDENGNELNVTHGTFISLLENPKREIRKDAYKSLYSVYQQHKNTIAATYNASVKSDVLFSSTRHYNSSLEAALFGNNISTKVYDNLLEAVNNNLHLMHRYVALRKKVLGINDLHQYDLYTPIVKDADVKISYEEAKKVVKEALKPLGEDYLNVLDEGFNNRWIDVYENEGKRSGAYSWGAYGTHPYVLLNHNDTLKNMFTLAHEMGHALHSYYSDKEQEYHYAQYPIFLAEVASTVNEALLMNHLLSITEDENQKKYLINYFMEQFRSTLYRQTMFAEFEKITHEKVENGEALNVDNLCEIYGELNERYYGPDLIVDDELKMEWARIPHFYRAFYVYQYSTGYSAAIAISERILKEGSPAIKDYLNFLKAGGSDYPLNILKAAGVDMTTPTPVENALKVFEGLIDEMEKTLGM